MNAFGPYLATIHLQNLLDEAELERRARLVRKGQPGVPAWRRSVGGFLASAARSLDPSVAEAAPSTKGRRTGASVA